MCTHAADFRRPQLLDALREYAQRVRKYGGLIQDVPPPEEDAFSEGGPADASPKPGKRA